MSDPRKHIREAIFRLQTYQLPHHGGHHIGARLDPVVDADWRGGMCDCRAALSIAVGAPLDLIDPVYGTHPGGDWTPTAYEPIQPVGPDGTYFLETP